MSEEQTPPKPPKPLDLLAIQKYMADNLEQIQDELSKPLLPLLRMGERPNTLFGLPIVYSSRFEPNGRELPLDHQDPLEADEVIEDALECDVVVATEDAPEDPLDAEIHLENCEWCARHSGRLAICSHCLEEKVCLRVPLATRHIRISYNPRDSIIEEIVTATALCRACRCAASRDSALIVID